MGAANATAVRHLRPLQRPQASQSAKGGAATKNNADGRATAAKPIETEKTPARHELGHAKNKAKKPVATHTNGTNRASEST